MENLEFEKGLFRLLLLLKKRKSSPLRTGGDGGGGGLNVKKSKNQSNTKEFIN